MEFLQGGNTLFDVHKDAPVNSNPSKMNFQRGKKISSLRDYQLCRNCTYRSGAEQEADARFVLLSETLPVKEKLAHELTYF